MRKTTTNTAANVPKCGLKNLNTVFDMNKSPLSTKIPTADDSRVSEIPINHVLMKKLDIPTMIGINLYSKGFESTSRESKSLKLIFDTGLEIEYSSVRLTW